MTPHPQEVISIVASLCRQRCQQQNRQCSIPAIIHDGRPSFLRLVKALG